MKYQIMGGLINGFIESEDQRVIFLPYNPMRPYLPPELIAKEIEELIEKLKGNRGDLP